MNDNFNITKLHQLSYMGENHDCKLSFSKERHAHGFVFFKGGGSVYKFGDGTVLKSDVGDFVYLPKFSNYTSEPRYEKCGEVFLLDFLSDDDNFLDGKPFVLKIRRSGEMENLFRKLHSEMFSRKPHYSAIAKSIVYNITHIVFTELDSDPSDSSTITKLLPAVLYIDEHFTDPKIRVSHLASMCNMSENHFRKLFGQVYGKSPVKYINEKKVAYATECLTGGLYTVADVADLAGFSDIGYFSKFYKKVTGENPSDVRHDGILINNGQDL